MSDGEVVVIDVVKSEINVDDKGGVAVASDGDVLTGALTVTALKGGENSSSDTFRSAMDLLRGWDSKERQVLHDQLSGCCLERLLLSVVHFL